MCSKKEKDHLEIYFLSRFIIQSGQGQKSRLSVPPAPWSISCPGSFSAPFFGPSFLPRYLFIFSCAGIVSTPSLSGLICPFVLRSSHRAFTIQSLLSQIVFSKTKTSTHQDSLPESRTATTHNFTLTHQLGVEFRSIESEVDIEVDTIECALGCVHSFEVLLEILSRQVRCECYDLLDAWVLCIFGAVVKVSGTPHTL